MSAVGWGYGFGYGNLEDRVTALEALTELREHLSAPETPKPDAAVHARAPAPVERNDRHGKRRR